MFQRRNAEPVFTKPMVECCSNAKEMHCEVASVLCYDGMKCAWLPGSRDSGACNFPVTAAPLSTGPHSTASQ